MLISWKPPDATACARAPNALALVPPVGLLAGRSVLVATATLWMPARRPAGIDPAVTLRGQ